MTVNTHTKSFKNFKWHKANGFGMELSEMNILI
jgi:hypothetical protein